MNPQLAKFELGDVIVTPTAQDVLQSCGQKPEDVLARHQAGDWGDASEHEKQVNEQGLSGGFNLQSVYTTASGQRVTIVTNADRTMTFVHVHPRHR